jgi:hypothetical protein
MYVSILDSIEHHPDANEENASHLQSVDGGTLTGIPKLYTSPRTPVYAFRMASVGVK